MESFYWERFCGDTVNTLNGRKIFSMRETSYEYFKGAFKLIFFHVSKVYILALTNLISAHNVKLRFSAW